MHVQKQARRVAPQVAPRVALRRAQVAVQTAAVQTAAIQIPHTHIDPDIANITKDELLLR